MEWNAWSDEPRWDTTQDALPSWSTPQRDPTPPPFDLPSLDSPPVEHDTDTGDWGRTELPSIDKDLPAWNPPSSPPLPSPDLDKLDIASPARQVAFDRHEDEGWSSAVQYEPPSVDTHATASNDDPWTAAHAATLQPKMSTAQVEAIKAAARKAVQDIWPTTAASFLPEDSVPRMQTLFESHSSQFVDLLETILISRESSPPPLPAYTSTSVYNHVTASLESTSQRSSEILRNAALRNARTDLSRFKTATTPRVDDIWSFDKASDLIPQSMMTSDEKAQQDEFASFAARQTLEQDSQTTGGWSIFGSSNNVRKASGTNMPASLLVRKDSAIASPSITPAASPNLQNSTDMFGVLDAFPSPSQSTATPNASISTQPQATTGLSRFFKFGRSSPAPPPTATFSGPRPSTSSINSTATNTSDSSMRPGDQSFFDAFEDKNADQPAVSKIAPSYSNNLRIDDDEDDALADFMPAKAGRIFSGGIFGRRLSEVPETATVDDNSGFDGLMGAFSQPSTSSKTSPFSCDTLDLNAASQASAGIQQRSSTVYDPLDPLSNFVPQSTLAAATPDTTFTIPLRSHTAKAPSTNASKAPIAIMRPPPKSTTPTPILLPPPSSTTARSNPLSPPPLLAPPPGSQAAASLIDDFGDFASFTMSPTSPASASSNTAPSLQQNKGNLNSSDLAFFDSL